MSTGDDDQENVNNMVLEKQGPTIGDCNEGDHSGGGGGGGGGGRLVHRSKKGSKRFMRNADYQVQENSCSNAMTKVIAAFSLVEKQAQNRSTLT